MHSFTSSFLFTLFFVISCSNVQHGSFLFSNAETLADKWGIGAATTSIIGDTAWLTFDVHESITQTNIEGTIREKRCDDNGREFGADPADGIWNIRTAVATPGKGSIVFDYDINILRNNSNIYESNFTDEGQEALCRLCGNFVLKIGNRTANFRDVDFTMNYNFTTLIYFQIPRVGATDQEASKTTVAESHSVVSYLCNPAFPGIPLFNVTYSQGSLLSVCVTPSVESVAEGLVMKQVDWFEWKRDSTEQPAIESGLPATNALTHYDCTPGSLYCKFSTILFADFYLPARRNLRVAKDGGDRITRELAAPITVVGSGQATMMFANSGRQLDKDGRALQSRDEKSSIDLSVNIQTLDDENTFDETTASASSRRIERFLFVIGLFVSAAIILM